MIVDNPALLAIFRAATRCECCGTPTPGGCDPSHILAKGMGGGGQLDVRINLASLARLCHTRHHAQQHPSTDELLAIASEREQVSVLDIVEALALLRRVESATVTHDRRGNLLTVRELWLRAMALE